MANWNETYTTAIEYKVEGGSIQYYTVNESNGNKIYSLAGTIAQGATLGLSYDQDKDAMLIISCSNEVAAVGKYIRSPINSNGVVVVNVSKDRNGNPIKASTEAKTTTTTDGAIAALNIGSDGTITVSGEKIEEYNPEVDPDFFEKEYTSYITEDQYLSNLSSGLAVQDLRGILGMPHQFTPITDPRIDSTSVAGDDLSFGRVYSEKIIKHIPLLLMTPGVPSFMTSYSEAQKSKIINKLVGLSNEGIDKLTNGGSGKYYSLKYAYTDYFYYVNAMLRSAAMFLGIGDETVDGKKLSTMNWLYQTSTAGGHIFGHGKLSNFLGPYAGCLAFYADSGQTVDESFSNSTSESQLSSALGSLSDQGRELNFLIGNADQLTGFSLSRYTGQDELMQNMDKIRDLLGNTGLGSNSIFSNIINKAQTILAGGRMMFPEIWSDSSFSRSYSCNMKLVSPSGDKLSVFLNILVPIYHLLGFTLPRQAMSQSYFSPFLVRAYYKGVFNVDMGIITGLSITKGAEGEWTLDGIPTVANVSFEIKDLYNGLFMSKQESILDSSSIMSNIQELDYIANSCGVNVNDQEVMRTVKMLGTLGFTSIKDKVTIDIFGQASQYFNQKMNNIFGVF